MFIDSKKLIDAKIFLLARLKIIIITKQENIITIKMILPFLIYWV